MNVITKLLLFIAVIMSYSVNGQLIETFAGTGIGSPFIENSPILSANIDIPGYGCFDSSGNYYFGQNATHPRICKITTNGIIYTLAGTGVSGFSGDNGLATSAKISYPVVKVDKAGNAYVADYYNSRLRKVDINTGIIHTIAGNGTATSTGDGALAINCTIVPIDVAIDDNNNIFVSDNASQSIRKIDPTGIINTVANINGQGICFDALGDIYLGGGTRIYKVHVNTGVIDTIAGTGMAAYNGDGLLAKNSNFRAYYIARDKEGNIYLADDANDRIRKIDLNGIIHTVAGNGIAGYSGDGNLATDAKLHDPWGIAIDTCGSLYIADSHNNRIRKVTFNPNCALVVNDIKHVDSRISIYPNPTTDEIEIAGADKSDISIINTLGQVLIEQKQYAGNASVNVSVLNAGVYYVVVRDRVTGEKVTRRFVKK